MILDFWKRVLSFGFTPLYFDSPDPPAPDPRIGEAAAANADVAREALAFNKQVYEEGKPRQAKIDEYTDQVVKSFLSTQDKANAASDDYLNYMKSTFRPLEQSLTQQAADFNTEGRREELAAQGAADVEQAAATADATARRDAARYGINPADGAMADQLASSSLNRTAAKVGVMNNARTAARAEGRAFQFDAAGLGRNLPAAGASSAQLGLQAGSGVVNAAAAPAANARADASVMNQGFNSAVGANQSAGNLYAGLYNGQLQAYNAEVSQNNAGMAGLGQLGAMALFKYSSKDLKHNKRPVAAAGVLKKIQRLDVEKWDYKPGVSDGGTHLGPYSQDVHREFGDVVAPAGKMIDIVSMNGIALAGIKALADKVDKLEVKTGRTSVTAKKGVKA